MSGTYEIIVSLDSARSGTAVSKAENAAGKHWPSPSSHTTPEAGDEVNLFKFVEDRPRYLHRSLMANRYTQEVTLGRR